jgi:hypothetical protein
MKHPPFDEQRLKNVSLYAYWSYALPQALKQGRQNQLIENRPGWLLIDQLEGVPLDDWTIRDQIIELTSQIASAGPESAFPSNFVVGQSF